MERQPSFPATSLTGSSVPSLPSMSCVVPWRSARGACPPCRGWSLGSIRPAKEEKGSLGKICDLNRPKVLGCRWTLAVTLMVMFTSQVVVLGGDLRKILPVVEGGGRSQTVNAAITSLSMWYFAQIIKLKENMRLKAPSRDAGAQSELVDLVIGFYLCVMALWI